MIVDVNTDWKYTVVPEVIGSLKRNEETEIQLTLSPPVDIGVGEYQAKLNAEVTVDNRKFEAPRSVNHSASRIKDTNVW